MNYASVVVDLKNNLIEETYDYSIPPEFDEYIVVGSRVFVPFGNTKMMGYVLSISDETKFKGEIKPILSVLDYDKELTQEQIDLAKFMTKQYRVSLVSALAVMIPSFLKGQARKYFVVQDYNSLSPDLAIFLNGKAKISMDQLLKKPKILVLLKEEITKGNVSLDYNLFSYGKSKEVKEYYVKREATSLRSAKRMEIYDYLSLHPYSVLEDIITNVNCTSYLVRDMLKADEIQSRTTKIFKTEEILDKKIKKEITFTFDQKQTNDKYNISKKSKFLLFSNDDEYKLNFMLERIKESHGPAMVVCPTVMLQEEVFLALNKYLEGYNIYAISNKVSYSDRYDAFMSIKYNKCDILVCTMSGIFMPFTALDTCILVDEENTNYLSDTYPYFKTSEVVSERCDAFKAKLILTSAAPSITTYSKVENREYILLPSMRPTASAGVIVDMKEEILDGANSLISNTLKNQIDKTLAQDKQVMLIVPSIAYATLLKCADCGKILVCPDCGVSLNLHEKGYVYCPYCNYKNYNYKCTCGSDNIFPLSYGQEKVSEIVSEMWPNKRIVNVNSQVLKNMSDYDAVISSIEEKMCDIIIGTNILSKSIDNGNIDLIAAINIDSILDYDSYRSKELTYSTVASMTRFHNVVIQTYHSDAMVLRDGLNNNFYKYYTEETEIRKALSFEPYKNVSRLTVSGVYEKMYYFANYIKKIAKYTHGCDILGPVYDKKRRGVKLILKYDDWDSIINVLDKTMEKFKNDKLNIDIERYPRVI